MGLTYSNVRLGTSMEIKELRKKLRQIQDEEMGDYEVMHSRQDEALLEFINDKVVTEIFNHSTKWYA
jgi:hypothetical protein